MKPEITPLQLAEEIPPEVLQSFYGGRRKRSAYKGLSRTAQYHLEMALSLSRGVWTDNESESHLDAAHKVLGAMTTGALPYGDKALPFLYSEAAVLWAQLPVFKERCAYSPEISVDSMGLAHAGMVRVLTDRINRRRNDGLKLSLPVGRRAELELAGLLSREGRASLFPYFSVAREERDNSNNSKYNHDFYTITDSGKKVPVQIKTVINDRTRQYDPSVLLIGRSEMEKVVPGVDIAHGGISTLLGREERGKLGYRERRQLTLMSQHIIDLVQRHAERNL